MNALFIVAMYLILALSPMLGLMCFRTKHRAWITFIVLLLIIDIVVILFIFRRSIG